MPSASYVVRETDGSGRITATYTSGGPKHSRDAVIEKSTHEKHSTTRSTHDWRRLLGNVFLPEGYPYTVSSDYLQYQIWNALQAFCSSLAGLFASRAVLQGHGVGNASASATNAILLTVIQDAFSRLTTIVAGYYLGTSLYPEAKTYRLLADILNDTAMICDTLSPHLAHFSFSPSYPFLVPATDSPLRVVALCLSGGFRSLCGAVAGGSKAALTVHFATAGERPGDVGDLSAKDGSKETVLALLGMLCGTVVLNYVHSARATYVVLFSLIFCHLAANVAAVRVIAMRTFNRQRASIAWLHFRSCFDEEGNTTQKPVVFSPTSVSRCERIFTDASRIHFPQDRGLLSGRDITCSLGAPFSSITGPERLNDAQVAAILQLFAAERYIMWYNPDRLHFVIVLKEGHGAHDHLKAWAHAHEVPLLCLVWLQRSFEDQLDVVRQGLKRVSRRFPAFLEAARAAGWKTEEGVLVGGSPVTIAVTTEDAAEEDRKHV
ncbi:DUF647-domain-containing protein [Lenzites betulinus]|nr:DUF647-domain-containing protein [Lenzites betulinus]